MATTQQEIAERLKVSRSLVARVLSDTSNVRVSDDTRRRILLAASEMGYRPNTAARSLRTGKTYTVTFLHSTPRRGSQVYAYIDAVEGCLRELSPLGYELKVHIVEGHGAALGVLDGIVSSRSCDAVVLWSSEEDVVPQAEFLSEAGFPFVVKGRHEDEHPEWPQIDYDHEAMMAEAVRHLVRLGHSRIAYLGYENEAVYSRRLRDGFADAMLNTVGRVPTDADFGSCGSRTSEALAVMNRWLRRPAAEQPSAVVIGAGLKAWQALEIALANAGRHIGEEPGSFGVSGIGARDMATLFGPAHCFHLTDLASLAEEMVKLLLAPVLLGQAPENSVVRVCPKLAPSRCLNLLNYVDFAPAGAPKGLR